MGSWVCCLQSLECLSRRLFSSAFLVIVLHLRFCAIIYFKKNLTEDIVSCLAQGPRPCIARFSQKKITTSLHSLLNPTSPRWHPAKLCWPQQSPYSPAVPMQFRTGLFKCLIVEQTFFSMAVVAYHFRIIYLVVIYLVELVHVSSTS